MELYDALSDARDSGESLTFQWGYRCFDQSNAELGGDVEYGFV